MAMPFVSLGVLDILKTSEFFLKKVKDWKSNEMELNYNLFGFVVSTASIPDYLLHFYYIKYFKPEQITKDRFEPLKMNEYIDECKFCKNCRRTGNQEAQKFIYFWNENKMNLKNDPNIIVLFKLRHTSIHHKLAVKPTHFFHRFKRDFFGWIDEEEDINIDDGVKFCRYCYDKINEFVNNIRNNF